MACMWMGMLLLLLLLLLIVDGEDVVEEMMVKVADMGTQYRVTVDKVEGKMKEGMRDEVITQISEGLLSEVRKEKRITGTEIEWSFGHLGLHLRQQANKLYFPSIIQSADERVKALLANTRNAMHEIEFPEGLLPQDVDAMLFVMAYRRGVRAMVEMRSSTSSASVHKIISIGRKQHQQLLYYHLTFNLSDKRGEKRKVRSLDVNNKQSENEKKKKIRQFSGP